MKFSAFPLSFLGAAALVDASPTSQDAATPFLGTGRLTALHDTDREYMGCITDAGLWTVDKKQCGTFKGVSTDDYGGVHLSSALGICGVCNGCGLTFSCGKDGVETDFYTWTPGNSPAGLYTGDLAGAYYHAPFTYPAGTEALSIQLIDGQDSGKWIVFGWNATSA